jgi:hypothetical protein
MDMIDNRTFDEINVGGRVVPLSSIGFLERPDRVRRGERGVGRLGGPLWSPVVPFHLVPLPM